MSFFLTHKQRSRFGFTVIELLVTMAIIAILASVVILNFTDARAVARDKIRISDLEQIRTALALYRAEYGSYPSGHGVICTNPDRCDTDDLTNDVSTALVEFLGTSIYDPRQTTFDSSVPVDNQFWYYYHSSRRCTSEGPDLVTVHARHMEVSSHRNSREIQDYHCPALDGVGHGLGSGGEEAYLLIIDTVRE